MHWDQPLPLSFSSVFCRRDRAYPVGVDTETAGEEKAVVAAVADRDTAAKTDVVAAVEDKTT